MKEYILAYTNTCEPYEDWYMELGLFTSIEAAISYCEKTFNVNEKLNFSEDGDLIETTLYFREDYEEYKSAYDSYVGFKTIHVLG